ncbi:MAG: DUF2255 family protein [Thaumarchaeota archaeon]|nr:DUF2255 family protein [Nitrososphaerota archaeon]
MTHSRFAEALSGEQEVQITVVKSDGGKRTLPVWFTVEGDRLQMLPMYGIKTLWFRAIAKNGVLTIAVKKETKEAKPEIVRDPRAVDRVKAKFAAKYGADEVKGYYPTSEVLLEVRL